MIQANELRIGNVCEFNYKGHNRRGKVDWIQTNSVTVSFFERFEDMVNGVCTAPEYKIPLRIYVYVQDNAIHPHALQRKSTSNRYDGKPHPCHL